MADILFKNGTLVTDTITYKADLRVQDGKIEAVGENLAEGSGEVVDATGMLIFPGGVDAHTHFDLPMFGTISSDDHYSGHKAAAFGGTTTVMDFVSLDRPTLKESIEAWHRKAEKAAIDHSFHMNLTRYDEKIEKEIPTLPGMGITSLKVFTAYNGRLRIDDGSIFRALRVAGEHGMLVMAHCENGDVIDQLTSEALRAGHTTPEWHARTRPAWGAVEATLRACSLAGQAGAAVYIVHMNAGGEADMLQYAREHGIGAMGETCPQYLFFGQEKLQRPDGAKWICSPPVRTPADNERLWQGLAQGTIQTIGTDHCAFFFNGRKPIMYEGSEIAIPGKELGEHDFTLIPNGLPGVGDRLAVLWTRGVGAGKITANQFVALNATNPAKIFGLYPRKGALVPGADADIVLWDPEKKVRYGVAHSHQRTDYNLYEGWELTGMPAKVYLRGQLIVDGEKWLGRAGMGEFLPRQAGAPVL